MPESLFTPKGKPRLVKTIVQLDTGRVAIYAGKGVAEALQMISMEMTLYKAVRLSQLLTALYAQGMKDGRREIFDKVDGLKDSAKHRTPGRPKTKKKPKKKK